MSNTSQYLKNLSENTDRQPSPSMWGDCPVEDIISQQRDGYHWWEDFLFGPLVAAGAETAIGAYYKGFASTGGLVASGDEVGGTVVFSSDGDDEGASLGSRNFPFQISNSHGKLWFEIRLKTSTIEDTKHGFFVGLIDSSALSATVPIAADGTLADENVVGFHRLEGDGDKIDTRYKADGVAAVTVGTDAITLVADTYVKLGMKYDPSDRKLRFYKNGMELADAKSIPAASGTDFPNDVRLGLVIAMLNATATAPGNLEVDWVRIAQLGV
jgi:hypothetical protein